MKLQIRVDENGIISDVKFKTFGCGSAIASSSYMTERVKGLSLDEAGKIKNTEIAKELSLPPVKLHCSSAFYSVTTFIFSSSDSFALQCSLKTQFDQLFATIAQSVINSQTRSRPALSTSHKVQQLVKPLPQLTLHHCSNHHTFF